MIGIQTDKAVFSKCVGHEVNVMLTKEIHDDLRGALAKKEDSRRKAAKSAVLPGLVTSYHVFFPITADFLPAHPVHCADNQLLLRFLLVSTVHLADSVSVQATTSAAQAQFPQNWTGQLRPLRSLPSIRVAVVTFIIPFLLRA
jgi:hypothetical protein